MTDFQLEEWPVSCPYCGESITLFVDGSAGDQSLIEDCTVCCRPIVVEIGVSPAGGLEVAVHSEDD